MLCGVVSGNVTEEWGCEPTEHPDDRAEPEPQPDPVAAAGQRRVELAGAEITCNGRSGRVGEENQQSGDRLDDGCGQTDAGEFGGAEPADHRGVS